MFSTRGTVTRAIAAQNLVELVPSGFSLTQLAISGSRPLAKEYQQELRGIKLLVCCL
jgi:hypothetical protein